jgi:hypothetical protein
VAGDRRQSVATAPPPGDDAAVARLTRIGIALFLCAVLGLTMYVRLRLADVPLERDEGEYAYAGQLILQGVPPYAEVYNMKFPGAYYAYAGLMAVFGESAWGIRAGLLAMHVATVLLVFMLGRRLAGTLAGGVGAAWFALLALDRWSMGVFAHATHVLLLPAVAGALVTHVASQSGRAWQFVAAGALMGMAVIVKQHAVVFVMASMALSAVSARSDAGAPAGAWWRRALCVGGGAAAVLLALVGLLAAQGVLDRFWFWTVEYGAAYASQTPASAALPMFRMAWSYITQATGLLWYVGLAGVPLLLAARLARGSRLTLFLWFAAAALSTLPGFVFRPHYFIVVMPFVCLLAGVAIATLGRMLAGVTSPVVARGVALALAALVAGAHVGRDSHFLFRMQAPELVRAVYQTNPFLESPEVARYLREHTAPGDRIAVLGSEPQIFFYAGRRSATGYIYTYALMEVQPFAARMQDEMRAELEVAEPAYLVFVGLPSSWGTRPDSNTGILTWASGLVRRCYEHVGTVDIPGTGPAVIRWDADALGYQPQSTSVVMTYRRKC